MPLIQGWLSSEKKFLALRQFLVGPRLNQPREYLRREYDHREAEDLRTRQEKARLGTLEDSSETPRELAT